MNPAGDGDGMGGSGRCGVDVGAGAGQNRDANAGSKKRKAEAMSRDSNNDVGCRGSRKRKAEAMSRDSKNYYVGCRGLGYEDSQKISPEIEKMRSELEEYVKALGFCKENEKLRVEMDLKDKEVECLRKQNEELKASYNELQIKYKKQIEKMQAKHEKQKVLSKRWIGVLQWMGKKLDKAWAKPISADNEMVKQAIDQADQLTKDVVHQLLQELVDHFLQDLKELEDWKRKDANQQSEPGVLREPPSRQ